MAAEFRNLVSATHARTFSGAYVITDEDPQGRGRASRAIVAEGSVVVVGMDDVNVTLPDLGNFQWNIQAKEIVSGDGTVFW